MSSRNGSINGAQHASCKPAGFMSSGDMAIPGNAGLKDQVMGMRWIQENIRAFCGDPNKVTLVGASFGAISIGLHMISPLSKGALITQPHQLF